MALAAWLEDGLCSSHLDGRRRGRVDHRFQQSGGRRRGSLLQPCDGLPESRPASLSVRLLELGHLQPTKERIGANAGDFGGFLNVALGQQRSDRLFLLAPEFSAWRLHFPPNPTIGRSPVINADSACLFPRPE